MATDRPTNRPKVAPPHPGGRPPNETTGRPRAGRGKMSAEDSALWAAVKRSVTPLRPKDADQPLILAAPPPETAAPAPPQAGVPAVPVVPKRPLPPPPQPALQPLARKEKQKLVRGNAPIDGRIDLHGLTQAEAHARLLGFVAGAQARGARTVLVITGKGRSDGGRSDGGGFEGLHQPERGVLRRMVPLWLALPEFRRFVLGFEEAHFAHGGSGAIYVMIRKRKA